MIKAVRHVYQKFLPVRSDVGKDKGRSDERYATLCTCNCCCVFTLAEVLIVA